MDWNCTLTEERLSDYLEGKLSPPEAAAFSAHMANCANCTETVAQVSALVDQMHTIEMVAEPPELMAKILDATLGPRTRKESWRPWFGWISVVWQPRFGMGSVLLLKREARQTRQGSIVCSESTSWEKPPG